MIPVTLLAAALTLPAGSDDTPLATVRPVRESSALEVWAERLRLEGRAKRIAGRPADALPLLNAAALLRPDDPNVVGGRALVLTLLGRHDDAADDYARQVALAPNESCTWNSVAEGWIARGRFDEAQRCFERAFQLTNESRRALARLGQALAWVGADEVPWEAPCNGPEYFERGASGSKHAVHFQLTAGGIQHAAAAQHVRAETALTNALALVPEADPSLRGTILYARGYLRMELRLRKLAAVDFEESLKHRPVNYSAYEHLGHFAFDRGDYVEALRCLDLADRCGMPRLSQLRKRGECLLAAGELEKAERCAAAVCELAPNDSNVLRVHAMMLWHFGKDDLAQAQMEKGAAVAGLPLAVEAFFEMTSLCDHFKDFAAAERIASRLLGRPDLTPVQRYMLLVTLGTVHMRVSREEEAFDDLTQAILLMPKGMAARYDRAGLALRLKRSSVAMEDADVMVRVYPHDPKSLTLWRQVWGNEEMAAALAGRRPDYRPVGPVVRVPITVAPAAQLAEESVQYRTWREPLFRSMNSPVAASAPKGQP